MFFYKIVFLLFLFLNMLGCSRPCDELLKNTCGEYGEESKKCRELKLYLKDSSSEMQRSCQMVIKIISEMNKEK